MALASAFIATLLSIIIINSGGTGEPNFLYLISRLLFICTIAFPLFFGLQLFSEQQGFKLNQSIIYIAIALIFLISFFFYLPSSYTDFSQKYSITAVIIAFAISLLSIIAPFSLSRKNQGLWQFLWKLFLRAFITFVFASVIVSGISGALFAVNFLLSVEIDAKVFGNIWVLAYLFFAPWFFLGGVSNNFSELEEDYSYPKLLDIFTKYIMLPLTAIYILILFIYGLRVIFTGDWPSGQVVLIITSLIIPSITTAKLLFPKRDQKWVKWIIFSIYASILPLMILYFVSIWFRVVDYGLTEQRYLVIIFGLWVIAICLYYLISKQKLLKVLPISAAILLLISSFGPWGMFEVSKNQQLNRLEYLLIENKILVGGQIQNAPTGEVELQEAISISENTEYLLNVHGASVLKPWYRQNDWDNFTKFDQNLVCEYNCDNLNNISIEELLVPMGVEYTTRWQFDYLDQSEMRYFSLYHEQYDQLQKPLANATINIKGYQELAEIYYYTGQNNLFSSSNSQLQATWRQENYSIILKNRTGGQINISLKEIIEGFVKTNKQSLSRTDSELDFENESFKIKLILKSVDGQAKGNEVVQINSFEGIILIETLDQ